MMVTRKKAAKKKSKASAQLHEQRSEIIEKVAEFVEVSALRKQYEDREEKLKKFFKKIAGDRDVALGNDEVGYAKVAHNVVNVLDHELLEAELGDLTPYKRPKRSTSCRAYPPMAETG